MSWPPVSTVLILDEERSLEVSQLKRMIIAAATVQ